MRADLRAPGRRVGIGAEVVVKRGVSESGI
jgi:hypothetical protein